MASPFFARRKGRTVARGEATDDPSAKVRKASALRSSLDDQDEETVQVVRKTTSRPVAGSNTTNSRLLKTVTSSLSSHPNRMQDEDNESSHPTYSADALDALKAATPSLPVSLQKNAGALDLASKFGPDLALHGPSSIPSEAEIQEKKARRARLAQEQDYISLDADEPVSDRSSDAEPSYALIRDTRPREMPSRLAQDEDEIGEGFDAYVADGRVALTQNARLAQAGRTKDEIRQLIDTAEDAQDDVDGHESDSEQERLASYEAAQTAKAMDGLERKTTTRNRPTRPRTPPRITPLPTLEGIAERLEELRTALTLGRETRDQQLRLVRQEIADVDARKAEVQRLMKEAGTRFESMQQQIASRVEHNQSINPFAGLPNNVGRRLGQEQRGLETMGMG